MSNLIAYRITMLLLNKEIYYSAEIMRKLLIGKYQIKSWQRSCHEVEVLTSREFARKLLYTIKSALTKSASAAKIS